jgi:uncharacterized membrane protein
LFFLFAALVALLELRVLTHAYEALGIHPRYVSAILLLSLFGAAINLPVAHLPDEEIVSDQIVSFYGMAYVVPVVRQWPGTVIAVNIGGAVIPTLLSIYLLLKNRLWISGAIGVVLMSVLVHALAYPVKGVGIALPTFAPPFIAAAIGMLLAGRSAPALAYAAGSLGTLIGADLTNLDKIQGLGAPVASIGGAGTFDGIFLTGIVAVLLTWRPARQQVVEHDREGKRLPG